MNRYCYCRADWTRADSTSVRKYSDNAYKRSLFLLFYVFFLSFSSSLILFLVSGTPVGEWVRREESESPSKSCPRLPERKKAKQEREQEKLCVICRREERAHFLFSLSAFTQIHSSIYDWRVWANSLTSWLLACSLRFSLSLSLPARFLLTVNYDAVTGYTYTHSLESSFARGCLVVNLLNIEYSRSHTDDEWNIHTHTVTVTIYIEWIFFLTLLLFFSLLDAAHFIGHFTSLYSDLVWKLNSFTCALSLLMTWIMMFPLLPLSPLTRGAR